jgi:hypothetical protein
MNVALVDQDPNEGPVSDFGKVGEYAMVVTSYNTDGRGTNNPSNIVLWYKASGGWEEVKNTFNSGKKFYISPHFDYPDFTAGGLNAATGSVWVKTTTPSQGADWALKYYNGNSGVWQNVSAPLFSDKQTALQKLDNKTGGAAIPLGTVIVEYDTDNGQDKTPASIARANFTPWIRYRSSPTTISHANPTTNISKNLVDSICEITKFAGLTQFKNTSLTSNEIVYCQTYDLHKFLISFDLYPEDVILFSEVAEIPDLSKFDSVIKNKIEGLYSDIGWGMPIFNANFNKFFTFN